MKFFIFLLSVSLLSANSIEISAQKVEKESMTLCELHFNNLTPERLYKLSFLRENQTEYTSYPFLQKSDGTLVSPDKKISHPNLVGFVDFENLRGVLIRLQDTVSGETATLRYYPHTKSMTIDGIEITFVNLDPRGRNLLCKMRGFDPYEPFLCQTSPNACETVEGTANFDGTFTYLLTHTSFIKGGTDPFALYRGKTKKIEKSSYTWGKDLVRGKKNRILTSF